jgi:hypothetical protein
MTAVLGVTLEATAAEFALAVAWIAKTDRIPRELGRSGWGVRVRFPVDLGAIEDVGVLLPC